MQPTLLATISIVIGTLKNGNACQIYCGQGLVIEYSRKGSKGLKGIGCIELKPQCPAVGSGLNQRWAALVGML